MTKKLRLVLQDGKVFEGYSFGYEDIDAVGEIVFNTSMSGYQEVLTDPSYSGQMVCMTYPMIGNYGVCLEDEESEKIQVSALIVKEYVATPSNFRSEMNLGDYLKKHKVVGITGVETRELVRHIRDSGAQPALISFSDKKLSQLQKEAAELPSMEGQDCVKNVSTEKSYHWKEGLWRLGQSFENKKEICSRFKGEREYKVIAYDFGIKRNILRSLVDQGFDVTVVPASTPYQEVLDQNPDGVFLSNGPGDPAAVQYGIDNVKGLVGKVPLFGICLGHQILSLALGAKTFKLKFGHRGGNQPVKDLKTGKVEITSQNHGFAVDEKSLPQECEVSHLNLNDQTVEGITHKRFPLLSVQYHPEASPGPQDSHYLFKRFKDLMVAKS